MLLTFIIRENINKFYNCCFQKPLDDNFIWIGPNQPLTKYKAHPNGSYYTNWLNIGKTFKKGRKILSQLTHTDKDTMVSLLYGCAYRWSADAFSSMCNDKLDIFQDCRVRESTNITYFFLCEFDFDWIE